MLTWTVRGSRWGCVPRACTCTTVLLTALQRTRFASAPAVAARVCRSRRPIQRTTAAQALALSLDRRRPNGTANPCEAAEPMKARRRVAPVEPTCRRWFSACAASALRPVISSQRGDSLMRNATAERIPRGATDNPSSTCRDHPLRRSFRPAARLLGCLHSPFGTAAPSISQRRRGSSPGSPRRNGGNPRRHGHSGLTGHSLQAA